MPQVFELRINRNLCTGCNVCVVACPINFDQLKKNAKLDRSNAVLLVRNGMAEDVYDELRDSNCDGCGVCIEACPQRAITIKIL